MRTGIAEKLREWATDFDEYTLAKVDIKESMTIREAEGILIPVVGNAYCIEFSKWAGSNKLTWRIWDGKNHFEAKTLAAAVEKCLEKHRVVAETEPTDPVGDAQCAVDSVLAEPAGAL